MRTAFSASLMSLMVGSVLTACKDDTAPAVPETAARAVAVSGAQQSTTVGTSAHDPLSVVVYGTSGAVLAGASVQWTVTDGRGTISSAITTTDAQGIATVTFTADTTTGVAHVQAAVGTVAPVSFEETAVADVPARLIGTQPATDTVTAGQSVAEFLTVVDRYGNAVPNAAISVTVEGGDGGDVIANTHLVTDAGGTVVDTFVPDATDGVRTLVFTTDDGVSLSYEIVVVDAPSSASARSK